jgi:hypothetical protein
VGRSPIFVGVQRRLRQCSDLEVRHGLARTITPG